MLAFLNALAVAATCLGGLAPLRGGFFSRPSMWRLLALRSGILLGVAFVEVLPSALSRDAGSAGWGALAAFLLLFFAGSFAMADSCPEYLEECPVHLFGWAALAALSIHSFLDGVNFALSFSASAAAGAAVGTALVLHKLADGFTLTSLLRQSGYSRGKGLLGLSVVALATPAGSFLSVLGTAALPPGAAAALLGFAGGSFVYIGAADMLPRLHRPEQRSSLAYLAAGTAFIAALHYG